MDEVRIMELELPGDKNTAAKKTLIFVLAALIVGLAAGHPLAQYIRVKLERHKPYAQCGAGFTARIVGSTLSLRSIDGVAYAATPGPTLTLECERSTTRWARTNEISPECLVLTSRRGRETDTGHDICAAGSPAPPEIGPTAGGCSGYEFRYRLVRGGLDYCEKIEVTWENGPVMIVQ